MSPRFTHCLLCLSVGAWIATVPAQTGSVAHWRLDETVGTVAADSSPSGNTGTLVGFSGVPSWTTGFHGGALTFSAAQHVACALNAGLPAYDASGNPFTITAWVNGPSQEDARVYAEGSSTNNNPIYTLGTGRISQGTGDRFHLFIRNDAGLVLVNRSSATIVFDNTWHHVAVVDVAGSVQVYIDGQPDGANFNYSISGTSANVDRAALGAVLRAGTCCHLTGIIDDVRVYPFALSAAEVGVVLNDGPLVAGFQLNQLQASLRVNGATGSAFSAAAVVLALGQTFDLVATSNLGGNPWELAVDAGAAIPNAVVLTNNIVNLNPLSPSLVLLNVGFATPFGVSGLGGSSSTASATVFLMAPGAPTSVAVQFAMLDPGSVDGFHTSAPADITVQ